MTVKELMRKLSEAPQDALVYVNADLEFAEVDLKIRGCFQRDLDKNEICIYAK